MDITIFPKKLKGEITIIPSKSQAHRLLICAAFANENTTILCSETNEDIEATAGCLNSLGAKIIRTTEGYEVSPVKDLPKKAVLNCKESGSTLRFMLPVVGALGVDTVFQMAGRLPQRPLSPLQEELGRMGCNITRPTTDTLRCEGKLRMGDYEIDGSVSSQFITGLLFALVLINKPCHLKVTGKTESRPYIAMTLQALKQFGVQTDGNVILPSLPLKSPKKIQVEGDWSNAAFFLAANTLGSEITLLGLSENSCQGDRVCQKILENTDVPLSVSAADTPDLVPILSVVAGAKQGGKFTDIARLRLKESDRVASIMAMLESLGVECDAIDNTLTVKPATFQSCTVDGAKDHRIAMSAAIAATCADGPVTIKGAECVAKSYPNFWEIYKNLGGQYE